MSIVNEEVQHENLPIAIQVTERTAGESRQPWKMIYLEVDTFDALTPKELRDIGKWLVSEGRRIGREYKSNGATRNVCHD